MIKKWKQKDGKVIKIKDMDNQHLLNARNMLIRTAIAFGQETVKYYYGGMQPSGDAAQDMFDMELNAREQYEQDMDNMINALNEEIFKRGLESDSL